MRRCPWADGDRPSQTARAGLLAGTGRWTPARSPRARCAEAVTPPPAQEQTLKRILTLAGTTATALGLLASPAQAAAAEHLFLPEHYDGSEHLSAQESPCGPWAATFHKARTGGYRLLLAPGGQVEGEVHLNGRIEGAVELVPTDTALPTYAGSYRESVVGVPIGVGADGEDALRVAHFRLRLPLQGSDGSRLTLVLSGKATLDAQGRAVVERGEERCA